MLVSIDGCWAGLPRVVSSGEWAVVARGLPCLFIGDLNIEATKIPY